MQPYPLRIFVVALIWLPLYSCGGSMSTSYKVLSPFNRMFMTKDGHVPTYKTLNPNPSTTLHTLKWPLCFGKHSTVLGSFCVPSTTPKQEKSPKTELPNLSVDIQTMGNSQATIFMFDDEDQAWTKFRRDAYANKSCAAISEYANVVIHPTAGSHRTSASRSLKGKEPHMWHVVAVDCKLRTCPNVSSANVTFFHPSSDGSRMACSTDLTSFSALKGAMVEGWQALSIRNVLNVSGVNTFGVVLLYLSFVVFAALALLYAWQCYRETDAAKQELRHAAFYITSVTALCYLTMATGNGLVVLRKLGGSGTGWAYSKSLMATAGSAQNPNPFYDAKYAAAPTYPFFFVRELGWVLTAALALHYLSWVVGQPPANHNLVLFAGTARALCSLAATAITGGARCVFWLLSLVFLALTLAEINAMKHFAMRRGKHVTATYARLRLILLSSWTLAAVLWLPCAGAKAVSSDVDVALYAALDLLTVLAFTSMLVGGDHASAPALRSVEGQRLTEPVDKAPEFAGTRVGGDHDDLGDLEDNL